MLILFILYFTGISILINNSIHKKSLYRTFRFKSKHFKQRSNYSKIKLVFAHMGKSGKLAQTLPTATNYVLIKTKLI